MKDIQIPDIINQICEKIVELYDPDKIILFGSYARGTQNKDSDIDLAVISNREKDLPRYRRGLSTRVALSEFDLPKDVLFLTEEEIQKWRDVAGSLSNTIVEEGISIYERPGS